MDVIRPNGNGPKIDIFRLQTEDPKAMDPKGGRRTVSSIVFVNPTLSVSRRYTLVTRKIISSYFYLVCFWKIPSENRAGLESRVRLYSVLVSEFQLKFCPEIVNQTYLVKSKVNEAINARGS